jgi:hypothetical protein
MMQIRLQMPDADAYAGAVQVMSCAAPWPETETPRPRPEARAMGHQEARLRTKNRVLRGESGAGAVFRTGSCELR